MPPDDRVRILHMIEAADAVARFVNGKGRVDLDLDDVLLFALVRAVEIFGEAASKISASTKASIADVPWREIVATRNRLVHAYFDVDANIVWTAAIEEMPLLRPVLQRLIALAR